MEDGVEQAAHHERIWCGKSVRQTRRSRRTLDRGVSGQSLSAPDQHAKKDSVAGGSVPMGPDGFSLAAPAVARRTGLLQPQRIGFESRTAQAGVLCVAEVLSRDGFHQVGGDRLATLECDPEIPSATPFGWLPACPRSTSWDHP